MKKNISLEELRELVPKHHADFLYKHRIYSIVLAEIRRQFGNNEGIFELPDSNDDVSKSPISAFSFKVLLLKKLFKHNDVIDIITYMLRI